MAPPDTTPPLGVLLVNLGSPDAPTAPALRRYLDQFLSDPLVVDLPRWLWLPLLRGVILRRRAPHSAELYARVWGPDGAPLLAISRRQARALDTALGDDARVVVGMRYGEPSLLAGLRSLRDAGCGRVVCLPMFPQEAGATVGSVRLEFERALGELGWDPPQAIVPPHPEDDGYLAALAGRVRAAREVLPDGGRVDLHLFSFHGIPLSQVRRGDPYPEHCRATAEGLAAKLGLAPDAWRLVYQSRFGPAPWLQPYADETVRALAATHKRLLVACPGFTADCLETLDEIGEVLAADFRAAGGERLDLVPCLNDDPAWVAALRDLVRASAATLES